MSLADISILTALKSKMRWHQTRQTLLAENVANADTPGYMGRDLKPATFQELLSPGAPAGVATARTSAMHIAGPAMTASSAFAVERVSDWEVTPGGNGVVLEDQMMKVAENQMDYQMATSLYSRSLGLLRTAIGRR